MFFCQIIPNFTIGKNTIDEHGLSEGEGNVHEKESKADAAEDGANLADDTNALVPPILNSCIHRPILTQDITKIVSGFDFTYILLMSF